MKFSSLQRWLLCCALSTTPAWAQVPAGAFATVNGVTLSQKTFDNLVQMNIAQGQKDTPQLRQSLKAELIARELLAQESTRRGLDKTAAAQEAWNTVHQNFLMDLLLNDHLAQNPITESDIKAEYERQSGLLRGAEQYLLRNIVVASETEAKAVIASLKSGKDFAQLARDKSLHASKEQGGNLGWLVSTDIVPQVAKAIAPLKKGAMVQTPIEVDGLWHVVQVDDRRPFQVPKMEDSLPQLRQALLQQRRTQLLEQVAKVATVQQ